nr:hypothetical protein [Tanacetum cinerariifolium]
HEYYNKHGKESLDLRTKYKSMNGMFESINETGRLAYKGSKCDQKSSARYQWKPLEEYDNPPSAKESICIPRLLTDSLQK